MLELDFQIEGADTVPYSATPLLNLRTRIGSADPQIPIYNVLLQCQVQIETARRRYVAKEQEQLQDLFGAPVRWSKTLRPILWANVNVVVPPFEGETLCNIPLPCTFDFNVAVTKYLYGLDAGEIPVCALFSGTIFYSAPEGLRVAKIPWNRESNYRVPVRVWKEMMEMHYPNTSWVCLRRDVFDQVYRYKMDRGIPTWEEALEKLLLGAEENEMRKAAV